MSRNDRDNGFGGGALPIQRSRQAQEELQRGVKSLRQLAASLAGAVRTLEDPEIPSVESGVDFYEEVRRFEIELITRALDRTGGIQNRAAVMLKLKNTTLNTKIKQYKILRRATKESADASNKF